MLRGGPLMKLPGAINEFFYVTTDNRKKLIFSLSGGLNTMFEGSQKSYSLTPGMTYKPAKDS